MLIEAFRALYDYNRWATERLIDAAEGLTAEQWLAPGVAGRGSIRDTLVHLISTHRSWLSWWDGSLPADQAYALVLDPAAFPDPAAVRAALADVDLAMRAFLATLQPSDLERVYSHVLPNGLHFRLPLWKMLLQVANHGTQHRSEVAAMLTGFGSSPGDLDLLLFFRPFDATAAGELQARP